MGGAYGGHYYAFVRSFSDGKWHKFDDSSVTEIDPDEIPTKAFGGGKSANAYKLMYRQVERSNEELITIPDDLIPEYLQSIIEADKIREEVAEIERAERNSKISVRVYYKSEIKLI